MGATLSSILNSDNQIIAPFGKIRIQRAWR